MRALIPLEAAVKNNNLQGVFAALDQLRAQGNDYEISNWLICTAVERGSVAVVTALLAAKRVLGRRFPEDSFSDGDCDETDLFIYAVQERADLEIKKVLIDAGYEPFRPGAPNVLHWAACTNNTALLDYIYDLASSRGLSINLEDDNGRTPLHYAASNFCPVAVQFLLQRGANSNALCHDGFTAFSHMVVIAGHLDQSEDVKRITELLVHAGLELEELTHSDWITEATPLMQASYVGVTEAAKVLLSAGAKLDTVEPNRRKQALHYASQGFSFECVRLLLVAGADVKARDAAGDTPLHVACDLWDNNEEQIGQIVRELIDHGADVNAKNNAGETPLHVACKNICEKGDKAVGALIQSGADLSILAAGMESCLHLVVKKLCRNCSSTFGGYDSARAANLAACALGLIEKLLKAGVKASSLNLDGLTAIGLLEANLPAGTLIDHKDIFAPIIVALIKGGDFSGSWGSVPKGCPGLGTAIEVVWNKLPEMLPQLFAKMCPDEQAKVRMMLRCLQRFFPSIDVRMRIISEACSNSDE